jgi:hypothetical protein
MRKERGLAAPILSKCARCRKPFRPHNRSDTEFCSNSCRQAAYRQSNALKQNLQLAKNMHDADDAARQYESYRALAVTLHARAARRGIEDVRFVATPSGIIVVGEYVRWAIYTPAGPDDFDEPDENLLEMPLRATEYDAGDPKIIEALSRRTLFAGSSLLRNQHENEDADAIQTSARYVLLLAFHGPELSNRRLNNPEIAWLMTNYAEGEVYAQVPMLNQVKQGGTDVEDNQTIAKELTIDQLSDDEVDGARHRDVREDEDEEDEGGRGYEVVDPKP